MTNSYNSSKRPKLLIIHGLNNNLLGFRPLQNEFEKLGYECHLMTLPGHGKDRNEARNFHTAYQTFELQMRKHCQTPYAVIAFSQGALLLQHWLEANPKDVPLAQVLLAPALYIKHQKKFERLLSLLPTFFFILSQTPKKLRLYRKLHVWEYRTLIESMKKYQAQKSTNKVPTLILVDPEDELIDAKKLKQNSKQDNISFELIDRPYIRAPGLGKHHVLFHPDYFDERTWDLFIAKMASFLTSSGA